MKSHVLNHFIRKHWPLLLSVFVLLLLVGGYFIFPGYKQGVNHAYDLITSKDEARIRKWVGGFGIWGPLILIAMMVIQMFLLFVPNILVFMISIIMYGPVWGAMISLAGVFASSSFGYALGQRAGPLTVRRFVSKAFLGKIDSFIEHYGAGAIAITRLASLANDSLSIAAGLLGMNYRKYILATIIGITPLILLLAFYGDAGKIGKALYWIAAISVILLAGWIAWDKRRRKEQKGRYVNQRARRIAVKQGNK